MISIKNISKTFSDGTPALKDVSLEIGAGEFGVILGPSGSGKTTLMRSLNGLVTPDRGTISLDGVEVRPETHRQTRQAVGMVFQHFNLVGNLSTLNNVLTGLLDETSLWRSMFCLFTREQKLQALKCLDEVGLLNKAYVRADQLSGGQQQRVGIARAIVRKPRVILADEPVASLDPVIAFNVLSLLRDISRSQEITVVCNLHQVDFAMRFADRIIGLSEGQILLNEVTGKIDREYLQTIYSGHDQGMFFGSVRQPKQIPDTVPATA